MVQQRLVEHCGWLGALVFMKRLLKNLVELEYSLTEKSKQVMRVGRKIQSRLVVEKGASQRVQNDMNGRKSA